MSSRTAKIVFWLATGLLAALQLFSASMYFMQTEAIQNVFEGFGYPAYIVIPLAVAKILGVVAIVTRWSPMLKEWAYAGFFFDMALAITAHLWAADGGHWMAIFGLVCLAVSYAMQRWAFKE